MLNPSYVYTFFVQFSHPCSHTFSQRFSFTVPRINLKIGFSMTFSMRFTQIYIDLACMHWRLERHDHWQNRPTAVCWETGGRRFFLLRTGRRNCLLLRTNTWTVSASGHRHRYLGPLAAEDRRTQPLAPGDRRQLTVVISCALSPRNGLGRTDGLEHNLRSKQIQKK